MMASGTAVGLFVAGEDGISQDGLRRVAKHRLQSRIGCSVRSVQCSAGTAMRSPIVSW